MRIQDILNRKNAEPLVISPAMTIAAAARIIAERAVGMLVIRDADRQLLGCLSERDITCAIARKGAAVLEEAVTKHVTRDPRTVDPSQPVLEVMKMMTSERQRHVLAVADGELVGVVSIGDLLKARIDEQEQEAHVLRDIASVSRIAFA